MTETVRPAIQKGRDVEIGVEKVSMNCLRALRYLASLRETFVSTADSSHNESRFLAMTPSTAKLAQKGRAQQDFY
jgi:hypothetical protein